MNFLNAKLVISMLLVIISMVTFNRWRGSKKYPVTVGIILGIVSQVVFLLAWNMNTLSTEICLWDCLLQLTIYFFAPAVGIIACLYFLIAQYLMNVLVFDQTWTHSIPFIIVSIASFALAFALKKKLLRNLRPSICSISGLLFIDQLMSIMLLSLMLPRLSLLERSLYVMVPELFCKIICGMVVISLCRNPRFVLPKPLRFNLVLSAIYFVLLLLFGLVFHFSLINICRHKLDRYLEQLVDMPGIGVSRHLFSTCFMLKKYEGIESAVNVPSSEELKSLQEKYGLADISIVMPDGQLLCSPNSGMSNQRDYLEVWRHRFCPMVLNSSGGGVENTFAADNTPLNKKVVYAFVPFEDNSGYIFVAMDWEYYAAHSDVLGVPEVDNCEVGKQGTYVIVNKEGNRVQGVHQRYYKSLGLEITDLSMFETDTIRDRDAHITLSEHTSYTYCYGVRDVGKHYYMVLIPIAEIYLQRGNFMRFIVVVLLLIFITISRLRAVVVRRHWARIRDDYRRDRQSKADLITAKSIQTSVLPKNFPPYPWDLTVDLYASMEPAYEVGGDFYDFYYIGFNKIMVLVADVSGKGIPAAMFMMQAKSQLIACIQEKTDLSDAMTEVNRRLCQNNDAEMFVTCWVGILSTDSGFLEYVNAGHNQPYILHKDGSLTQLDKISGFFLAGLEDTEYVRHETRLLPGDTLFLYTDGITEANDPKQQMFEEKRLEEALKSFDQNGLEVNKLGLPAALCKFVNANVRQFIADAQQFDDMTMLALYYRGPCLKETYVVKADSDGLVLLSQYLEKQLATMVCPQEKYNELMIALDEVAANILSYSGSKEITMELRICEKPSIMILEFIDSGKPYDPLQAPMPNLENGEDRPIGGLGLFMLKNIMDNLSYNYMNGQNHFLLFKKLN